MSIAMTAWCRPHYFQQALQSWSRVRGIESIPFTVYLEPSPLEVPMKTCLSTELPHASLDINPRRLGVLENPYRAFETEFNRNWSDFVILAEEDITVSPDILGYFSWASREFEGDPKVLGVCAFAKSPADNPSAVFKAAQFSPLVWGTWCDRWFNDLGPTWDHDYSSGVNGVCAGWDWNIVLRVMQSRFFIMPRVSRSDHIGELGGVHMTPDQFDSSRAVALYDGEPVTYRLE